MDSFFDVRIIAFGTHLSTLHGHTIDEILAQGLHVDHSVSSAFSDDSPAGIARSMAEVSRNFAEIWDQEKENYDLVFCLGDRYEMFSAVSAGTPFNIKFAHIHGGETTLGAIDNKFRHCLSIFSILHFTSTEQYAENVASITGGNQGIYAIGALSLDNLNEVQLLSRDQFLEKYKIDLNRPTILVTYHPETVAPSKNEKNASQLVEALSAFKEYQVVITMPNADTMNSMMRKEYERFASSRRNVFLVENFGTAGYFTCMKHCAFVCGNSSSGIIEAASFGKYVVDIGDRQKGRMTSGNVIHSEADVDSIMKACKKAIDAGVYNGENIYFKKGAAESIINILKNEIKRPV